MRHHSIVARLGSADSAPVELSRIDTQNTGINFIEGERRLGYGLGHALEQLSLLGLRPSETAVDLALLAAAVTAADTRISRTENSQDAWTREIDLHLPVHDPERWTHLTRLIKTTLNFLTGDRWAVYFRPRPPGFDELAPQPAQLRLVEPTSVCLFSGGLDSFIGAIDLLASAQSPLLVSHYWDGITSTHQTHCAQALAHQYPDAVFRHIRARVGFPTDTVDGGHVEDTLRGRSFLFFSLAAMAADSVGGEMVVHVPENGLISLNVPLDPLRLGALSTRTTHPYYMARFDDLLRGLGMTVHLENPYAFMTKGQMAVQCADQDFLRREAGNTMSCSSPGSRRYDPDPEERLPKHCGRCVPCLIRRAAIREAMESDSTPYRIADLRAHVLNTNKAEGKDIRSFQLALLRLSQKPGRARFDIHRPGPLIDHPERLADYEAVYVAGLQEVGRLLNGVRAEPL
ncbi:7-cyano-7-deazaguanine synthase in queuosine biosynthesis [Paraburkholderia caballeronis]|uniref:Qat anti-phage system QueC-like protein QatC n=1 Tax=Paraburkholderia caballeronis TaxID=416943 RepID=UPI001065CDF5|nr:Qat anti-phage system QueC-like protein QatC [Paraburkholderia caballeronis]TDV38007.1 7-cyano-7-deazaguanine synthase in queuosine biosynthesis [Paraburkholderia caballeronis]